MWGHVYHFPTDGGTSDCHLCHIKQVRKATVRCDVLIDVLNLLSADANTTGRCVQFVTVNTTPFNALIPP